MRHKVSIERIILQFEIIHVLTTHILRSQTCGKSLEIVGNHTIRYYRRRERNRRSLHCRLRHRLFPVRIRQVRRVVLNFVLTQRHICVPTEVSIGFPSSGQFHPKTITLVHIFRNSLTNLIQATIEHKLILVVHVVTTHTRLPSAIGNAITHFIVHQTFSKWRTRIVKFLLISVARRFTMRHTERSIRLLVGSNEPSGTHFGVEEMKFLVGVVHRLLV